MGGVQTTGRDWLIRDHSEAPGFGLYSYLLFGSLPSDATRPLYLAAVNASMAKVQPISVPLGVFSPKQLNLYLIPLLKPPPAEINDDDLPDWVVTNYDYARAEGILSIIRERGTGIYILSVLGKGVNTSTPLAPPYLWQDLSHVESKIVVAWIQHFLDQAKKERPWEENMGEEFILELRNYVEKCANDVAAAIPAMATAIKWIKPGS
jgi:hypothetical protein